jgi:hypothetical protein
MNKKNLTIALAFSLLGFTMQTDAQTNKEKKSRYFQNNAPETEFNIQGFFIDNEKNEVDTKPVEDEYKVKITSKEADEKYKNEKRIIEKPQEEVIYTRPKTEEEIAAQQQARREKPKGYYTSYGQYRAYNTERDRYDRYYSEGSGNRPAMREQAAPEQRARVEAAPRVAKEKEIKMTNKEAEYQTTFVKRRYTNLDVLCDDLDLAKIQRPVFKGICSECAHDVDQIIINKNMSSLEKNYHLKQCYVLRDKRLRETLDDDQYKKFLRVKDADEYLILTKDPELKDGINK